ncbi:COG4648 family protein [Agrilutibacter solisilvae]|uniref:Ketosynthase n=1 Tax=Agrilutibacter solisilvae TaxID=2763317 RepID=A0A975ATH8_9GAMM|nr:ketosynthase [Lysobacter solisilvae]QSX79298.1 ketosynthase [Lysobacter solisilvae]
MKAALARLALALAYPPLAHWASHDGGGVPAGIALADLVLVILVEPLLRGRPWALALFAVILAALYALAGTGHTQTLLLAPPVLFLGLLSWFFGRSLRAPRTPVISRIVCALEGYVPARLPPELARYTRRLTLAWSLVLATLALVNAVLATLAVPGGFADRLGLVAAGPLPAWAVPRERWSLIANVLNYGIVGAFFMGEYVLRRRFFPHRPYRHFGDFVAQLARLGPDFWRGLFR